MKYLLDANVISELLKPAPASLVVAWMQAHQDESALGALTIAELAAGVEDMPDGKRKAALAKELRFLREDYADRILPFDEAAAWEWARYLYEVKAAGCVPPLMDSLLAAVARARGLKVATRNTTDFPLIEVVNPFEPES